MIDKAATLSRIKEYFGFSTDIELANFLGIGRSTLSNWVARDSIDYDLVFAKREHIDKNWLLTGNGEMLKTNTTQVAVPEQPAATSAVTDIAIRLGEQINENKHLHKENMMLKAEIEQLKNARSRVVEYSIPETSLMVAAENQEEYNIAKK